MKRLLLVTTLFGLAGTTLHAEDDPFSGPAPTGEFSEAANAPTSMTQVVVEFIELPHKELTKLLLENAPSADATELRQKVTALVNSGTASILDTQLVTSVGDSASVESLEHYMAPRNYKAPTVPDKIALPDKPEGFSPSDLKALRALMTPPSPESFEEHLAGSTLTAEPSVGLNGQISLKINPALTWHTGEDVFSEQKDPLGNVSRVQMPKSYSLHLQTELALESGKPALAGVLSPKDATGAVDLTRKVMIFVTATVIEVK